MEGFLITIFMLSVPILAAIIDKRLKASGKSRPQVHAEPVIFEDPEEEEEEATQQPLSREALPGQSPTREAVPPQIAFCEPVKAVAAAAQKQDSATAQSRMEPQRSRKPIIEPRAESHLTAEDIRRDRRKLILYKEIMSPKFEERI